VIIIKTNISQINYFIIITFAFIIMHWTTDKLVALNDESSGQI